MTEICRICNKPAGHKENECPDLEKVMSKEVMRDKIAEIINRRDRDVMIHCGEIEKPEDIEDWVINKPEIVADEILALPTGFKMERECPVPDCKNGVVGELFTYGDSKCPCVVCNGTGTEEADITWGEVVLYSIPVPNVIDYCTWDISDEAKKEGWRKK